MLIRRSNLSARLALFAGAAVLACTAFLPGHQRVSAQGTDLFNNSNSYLLLSTEPG